MAVLNNTVVKSLCAFVFFQCLFFSEKVCIAAFLMMYSNSANGIRILLSYLNIQVFEYSTTVLLRIRRLRLFALQHGVGNSE